MTEFYIKNPIVNAGDYEPLKIFTDSPVDAYLQQIAMVLGNEVPVLGAPDMISDIDDMVFQTNIDAGKLQQKIQDLIGRYCSLASVFTTQVNVNFYQQPGNRDGCFIDITIDGTKTLRMSVR